MTYETAPLIDSEAAYRAALITVLAGTKTLPQLLSDTRSLLADAWS